MAMLIIGSITENSNKNSKVLIINNSDRNFKLYLDSKYIDIINRNSKIELSVSNDSHVMSFYEIPINLFKFVGITFAYSIENFITQGCGNLLENIQSIIIKHNILADVDINDYLTMIITNDMNIVLNSASSMLDCNQFVEKILDRKRAIGFFILYIFPIFLLLILESIILLCIALKIMSNGYIKESITLIGVSLAIWLIMGFVIYNSKKTKLILSVIKNNQLESNTCKDKD